MKKLHIFGTVVFAVVAASVALGAIYEQFSPGGALSGTWNTQNVNVGAGTPFITGTLPVDRGGTGLIAGNSGGIPYFNGTGSLASSATLTSDRIVTGGGSGGSPNFLASSGTTTTVLHGNAAGAPTFGAVGLTTDISGTLPVGNGGTGLTAGTSGGIPYYSATNTLASSGALTANRLVLGGGAGVSPTITASLGTTTTLLHGNAAGAPTFGAVVLTTDVSGVLPSANGGAALTSGSFSANWTGCNAVATSTATWSIQNSIVTFQVDAPTCTSNAATFTIDNIPANIRPASPRLFMVQVVNAGVAVLGSFLVQNSAAWPFGVVNQATLGVANGGFTASGSKLPGSVSVTFPL